MIPYDKVTEYPPFETRDGLATWDYLIGWDRIVWIDADSAKEAIGKFTQQFCYNLWLHQYADEIGYIHVWEGLDGGLRKGMHITKFRLEEK